MKKNTQDKTPLFLTPVKAGFPNPVSESIDRPLDLHEHLVKHPASTFFVRVEGESMKNAGISDGDLLVVDRSLDPQNEDIILAVIEGEFTVKKVLKKGRFLYLVPENTEFKPIKIDEEMDFIVWGVVTSVIKEFRK